MPGLYRGGGESATVSRQMRFTFPERTGEECRQNGRRAESAIPPLGESATVSRQIDSHLHPQRRQMYACRISMTEDTVLCFMLPVQELFMKIAGAVANCRFYAKDCKSIPRVVQS